MLRCCSTAAKTVSPDNRQEGVPSYSRAGGSWEDVDQEPTSLQEIPEASNSLLELKGGEGVALCQDCDEGAPAVFHKLHHCHVPWAGVVTGINQDTYQA